MGYEELLDYIQGRCTTSIFRELDEFLTDLDDTESGIIELDNQRFKIKKNITSTDFEKGEAICNYSLTVL